MMDKPTTEEAEADEAERYEAMRDLVSTFGPQALKMGKYPELVKKALAERPPYCRG